MKLLKQKLPRAIVYSVDMVGYHNPYKPAVIHYSGEVAYYLNGGQHNIVGPQRVREDKTTVYRINGCQP